MSTSGPRPNPFLVLFDLLWQKPEPPPVKPEVYGTWLPIDVIIERFGYNVNRRSLEINARLRPFFSPVAPDDHAPWKE